MNQISAAEGHVVFESLTIKKFKCNFIEFIEYYCCFLKKHKIKKNKYLLNFHLPFHHGKMYPHLKFYCKNKKLTSTVLILFEFKQSLPLGVHIHDSALKTIFPWFCIEGPEKD